MSFSESAAEVLDRAEASLNSLLADALKAKAYRDVAAIAALTEAVAAIPGRAQGARRSGAAPDLGPGVAVGAAATTADAGKASEPSWMRPKTP